ncbi:CWF19-like protein 2 isoform X2 [Zootermopsis nevadensis]|uniref:CWF19-like protein 2 isoform X2 n=1 Tax=Zootermopsis nevadensis TaxID=136037 RepID=UPI000B8EB66C|nr:CWF19-like protein 2 isoform X2 [Zootermopsis nevadensis]XP_021916127.1 CWF19-like protein 2 isoform X2 [Zootermopsis nevadensis]
MSYINFESSRVKEAERKQKMEEIDAVMKKGSDDESEEDEWVEKFVVPDEPFVEKLFDKVTAGKSHSRQNEDKFCLKTDDSQEKQEEGKVLLERDEWMTLPGLFPSTSHKRLQLQSGRMSKAEEQRQEERYLLNTLGQSDRELNPYWKDGGTGLPYGRKDKEQLIKESEMSPAKSVGDRGVGWLRRALKRAEEQAADEGRSVEDVAAERWGSLQKLKTMLAEAEEKSRSHGRHELSRNECERNKLEDRKRKGTYHRDRTKRAVVGQSTKSCHEHEHDKSHTNSDSFQKSRTDDISDRKHDKQDSLSLGRRTLYAFQKPEEEIDVSGRQSTSYQDFSGLEVGGISVLNTCKSSVASGNWRKKISDNVKAPVNPSSSKESKRMRVQSSSSELEYEEEKSAEIAHILTDKEMNDLGAKLVKAEILGNETLAKELKKKLDAARIARARKVTGTVNTAGPEEVETVILTRTDSRGFVHPLQRAGQHVEPVGGRRRKQKMETHSDGKRVRYYADDDKYSLKDLFEREKLGTAEDQNKMFSKLAAKGVGHTDSEYDMDDIFAEQAQLKESDGKVQSRERGQAIREHKMIDKVLKNCNWCFDSKEMIKHLVVAIGNKVYVCLPPHQSLTEGHCLIVPMYHTSCGTQLDEDVWSEMQTFRKTLTSMFMEKLDLDVVFFETAVYLQKFPHMILECVPMPRETGDLAPIYFKKAILECETEWATNKKLVDLKGKNVRRAIPKGLPYFAVDFGLESGFAHVIEDEKMFPKNFAQEIIGGMLDLDHSLWRKQRRENFDMQRKKVLQFAEWWKTYDFTVKKEKYSSDSD